MRQATIRITFDPALAAERDDQRAAFVVARKQAEDDLWELWQAGRAARADRDRMWRELA